MSNRIKKLKYEIEREYDVNGSVSYKLFFEEEKLLLCWDREDLIQILGSHICREMNKD